MLVVVVLKEIKLVLPNSQRINRGNYKKTALTEACIDQKITDLILLKEHRGTPGQSDKNFLLLTDSFCSLWGIVIILHSILVTFGGCWLVKIMTH